MRKKQNTKSREFRAAHRIADAAVVCACFLGAAVFIGLFQFDLNQSLHQLNEAPVGLVAYKSRGALRRFRDRIIWDRLRKESAVYNGDFIRTAERSEAAVNFPGGELVTVLENSLVRIFVKDGVPSIEFSRGNIGVHTPEGGRVEISFGGNLVRTAAGSALSLEGAEEGNFSVQVIEGSASLTGPGGEREAAAGDAFDLDGGVFREAVFTPQPLPVIPEDAAAPLSPPPAAVYYYQDEAPELRFQWKAADNALHYILEAADNPGMANPVLQTTARYNSLTSSRFTEGQWYWRVTPVFPASYRGTISPEALPFTVRRGRPPEIPAGEPAAAVPAPEAPAAEPAPTAEPAAPAAAPAREQPPSGETRPLPAAAGRQPANGYVIGLQALKQSRSVVFNWEPVAGADRYSFTLFQETASGTRRTVTSFEGPGTSYTLRDLSLLDQGRFTWRVEALSREAGGSVTRRGIPGENSFTVDIPQPGTPQGQGAGVLYGR